jgi:DNA-binding NarL/FixJ family response regulator
MAAQFIEEGIEDSTEQTDSLVEDQNQQVQAEQQQEPEAPQEDDIPEKYRGKDVKEIIRMHAEAEKLIGRQGSEVGELRKIVDEFIKAQTSAKQQQPEVVEEVDFFANPEQAVAKAIENHPKIKQAEMAALQMKQAETINLLKQNYPDFMQTVEDPAFQNWVASSKIRTRLFAEANAYDYDSADELLSTWKERNQVAQATVAAEKTDRQRQLKAAAAVPAQGSDEAPSKKIYRRQDIIRLMQTDPDRYDSMQPEIMAAYAEGRVR